MSEIKTIGHQSIHSIQSAPPEGSEKKPEIGKEYKPAEFRPLSNEQKEYIKQTRNAENKMAESAIMAKTASSYGGILGGVANGLKEVKKSDKGLASGLESDNKQAGIDFVKAGGTQETTKEFVKDQKEFLPTQTGPIAEYNSSEPVLKAEKFFPSIRFESATPILDGEAEREEEPVAATEPLKTKSGNE
ncbi:hypothetical protein L0152_08090 [bacterium]|nr:hypothetical protein [bacterium]